MWVALLLLAQPANPYFANGQALAQKLKFAEAIEQLKVARQVPGAPELVQVLELLGTCLVAEGARKDAESVFAELLELRPEHELERATSPKISEVFLDVKHRLYPGDSVTLRLVASRDGEELVQVQDPYRKVAHFAFVARDDGGPWKEALVTPNETSLRLVVAPRPGHSVEWYLEAREEEGRVLASLGNAEEPQRRAVALVGPMLVAHATPRLERVPAWVAVGLSVVAGLVGALLQAQSLDLALRSQQGAPPNDWADTARATHQRAVTDATVATGLFIGAGLAAATGVVLFVW